MGVQVDLNANETLFKQVRGDYYAPGFMPTRQEGTYTFTNKRVVFTAVKLLGLGGGVVEIAYKDIQNISKRGIGFGILVETTAGEKHKLSLTGRDKYLQYIEENMK